MHYIIIHLDLFLVFYFLAYFYNYIISMKPGPENEFDSVYIRKALNVNIPESKTKQAENNPFSRFKKPPAERVLSKTLVHSGTRSSSLIKLIKPRRAISRPEFAQVQQPKRFWNIIREVEFFTHWLTTCNDETSVAQDDFLDEDPKRNQKNPDSLTMRSIVLTKEVEHYFSQMSQIELATAEEINLRKVTLKPRKELFKKTLILDMDDTLIHTINPIVNYAELGVVFGEIKSTFFQSPEDGAFLIKFAIRPYALQLLQEMSKIYEIIV